MAGLLNEEERSQLKRMVGFPMPKNQRDASQPWKKDPTPIAAPCNGPVRQQTVGPWSKASMGSNPPRKTPNGNRTAQQTLTSGSSTLSTGAQRRPTVWDQSFPRATPRKKQKTEHATTSTYFDEMGYVPGRGTLGARRTTQNIPSDADIITVEESDEDLGTKILGTPDPLNFLADGPTAKQLNKHKPTPVPFRTPYPIDVDNVDEILPYNPGTASGSRSVIDGDETRALEARLGHRLGEESDPIGEFSPSPPTKPKDPPPNTVKSLVRDIEGRFIDLRHIQPNQRQQGIKDRMKTKNSVQQPQLRDPEATRPTKFITSSTSTVSRGDLAKRQLRIKKWILGTERQPQEPTYFITWDPQDKLSLIPEAPKNSRWSFDVRSEVQSVEYSDNGDTLLFALKTAKPKSIVRPRNTERFRMGDSRCGNIAVVFDNAHKDWSSVNYHTFITWIKTVVDKTSVLRGPAAEKRWETAIRQSEFGDAAARRQKAPEVQSASAARPLKRRASADDDESTPPPVDELSRDPSSHRDASASSSRPVSRAIEAEAPIVLRRSNRRQKSPNRQRSPTLDPDEVILCYPQGVPGAVNITNSDFKRLQPGEFLNDTLIEFGLKLWLRRLEESNPELASQIHVFSSFFYKKLNRKNADEGYESVRKWTSKFDIFGKKYIIIPINENFHWYLVIIYQPEHTLISPPIVASPATRGRKNAPDAPKPSPKPMSTVTKSASIVPKPASTVSKTAPVPSTTKKPSSTVKPSSSAQPLSSTSSSKQLSTSPDEVQLTQSSEAEVEETVMKDVELLNFNASCSISVRSLSRSQSRASSVMEDPSQDRQDNMEIVQDSPSNNMEVDGDAPAACSRALSMTVSDYEESARPSVQDVDMDLPSASTSQLGPDYLFGGDSDVEDTSRSVPVEPRTFYGKQSKKARGKQKAIPNQAIIDQGVAIDEEDAEEDSLASSLASETKTYIFTFDSLGSKHPQAIKQLSRYLKKEAQDKLNRSDTSDPIGKQAQVPVQPNFCDCGLYLLHFAETFMSDPTKYCQIIKARLKGTMNLTRQDDWKGKLTGDMRERLARDIDQLSGQWKKDRAAKEEAKRREAAEGTGAIEVPESSDDEVDIVETTLAVPAAPTKKGGKGKAPAKGKAMRVRG